MTTTLASLLLSLGGTKNNVPQKEILEHHPVFVESYFTRNQGKARSYRPNTGNSSHDALARLLQRHDKIIWKKEKELTAKNILREGYTLDVYLGEIHSRLVGTKDQIYELSTDEHAGFGDIPQIQKFQIDTSIYQNAPGIIEGLTEYLTEIQLYRQSTPILNAQNTISLFVAKQGIDTFEKMMTAIGQNTQSGELLEKLEDQFPVEMNYLFDEELAVHSYRDFGCAFEETLAMIDAVGIPTETFRESIATKKPQRKNAVKKPTRTPTANAPSGSLGRIISKITKHHPEYVLAHLQKYGEETKAVVEVKELEQEIPSHDISQVTRAIAYDLYQTGSLSPAENNAVRKKGLVHESTRIRPHILPIDEFLSQMVRHENVEEISFKIAGQKQFADYQELTGYIDVPPMRQKLKEHIKKHDLDAEPTPINTKLGILDYIQQVHPEYSFLRALDKFRNVANFLVAYHLSQNGRRVGVKDSAFQVIKESTEQVKPLYELCELEELPYKAPIKRGAFRFHVPKKNAAQMRKALADFTYKIDISTSDVA